MDASATIIHHRHPNLIPRLSPEHEMPEMTLELLLDEFGGQAVFMSCPIGQADGLWANKHNRFVAGRDRRRA